MARILVIGEDQGFVSTAAWTLRLAGHHVAVESTGCAALRLAVDFQPHVAVIDIGLPDMNGVDAFRQLRMRESSVAGVFVTALDAVDAAMDTAIEALRLGACDYLQKPVTADQLLSAIKSAAERRVQRQVSELKLEPLEPHALTRWRDAILRFLASNDDAKNLQEFGRAVGVSAGGFRNWCRTASLPPRGSLNFARALRTVIRQFEQAPHDLLKITDNRTFAKFVKASGGTQARFPPSVTEFLERQQFIRSEEALRTIRAALVHTVESPRAKESGPAPTSRERSAGAWR